MKKSEFKEMLKQMIRNEAKLHKMNEADDIIQRIGDIAKIKDIMSMRSDLEKIFKKTDMSFAFSPVPHWRLKKNSKTIIIVNKKYADKPDLVAGKYAIGYDGRI